MLSCRIKLFWSYSDFTKRRCEIKFGAFHPTKAPFLRLTRNLANSYYYEFHKKIKDQDIADKLRNAPDWIKYGTNEALHLGTGVRGY